MANTGIKIVLTLEELLNGVPTGVTKVNAPGDPDYVAPFEDLVGCPVTYNLVCPDIYATGKAGLITFEFSLPNSTVNNPAIDRVRIQAIQTSTVIEQVEFILPNTTPNYFTGNISVLPAGSYTLNIEYLLGGTSVSTCTGATSYTVT